SHVSFGHLRPDREPSPEPRSTVAVGLETQRTKATCKGFSAHGLLAVLLCPFGELFRERSGLDGKRFAPDAALVDESGDDVALVAPIFRCEQHGRRGVEAGADTPLPTALDEPPEDARRFG